MKIDPCPFCGGIHITEEAVDDCLAIACDSAGGYSNDVDPEDPYPMRLRHGGLYYA